MILLMRKIIYCILFICFTFCLAKMNFAINNDTIMPIFKVEEVMPTYQGGIAAMMKFLYSNLRYPIEAKKKKLEGKVTVKFYIDKDGSVKEPIVLKDGVGGGAAEEAVRLVGSMPNWNPGTQGGQPVKVYYTLPVTFKRK